MVPIPDVSALFSPCHAARLFFPQQNTIPDVRLEARCQKCVRRRVALLGDALFEHGGDIWGEDVGVAGSCWKAPAIGGGLG